jgi:hypothetical protein
VFFDPIPPPDDPPARRQPKRPAWAGAPSGVLPGGVPLEVLLVDTDLVALALTRFAAYPSGFEVQLITVTSGDDDLDVHPGFGFGRMGRAGARGSDPNDDLRFGVQYADGSKSTEVGPGWGAPGRKPKGPVISQHGGSGGEDEYQQNLWVWPLPPAGPLTFAVEWRTRKIPLTTREVDATLIRAAAKRAQRLLPKGSARGASASAASAFSLDETSRAKRTPGKRAPHGGK